MKVRSPIYRNSFYDAWCRDILAKRVDFEIDNKSSGKKTKDKKIESVWMNY